MGNKAKIFSDLERIAPTIPSPMLWSDKDGIALGCNDLVLQSIEVTRAQLIGKNPYEYLPRDIADTVMKNVSQVIREKKAITFEESIRDINTGKIKYFLMARAPLFSDNGIDVVGIIVSGTDITDRKEKERLQKEIDLQQTKIAEQEIFRKEVGQLTHDIAAPIGTVQLVLKMIKSSIPEEDRNNIENAVGDISGLIHNLLNKYRGEKNEIQTPQPTLISLLLSQVLEGKKLQYANTSIKFTHNFDDCQFSFVNINQLALRRSISNLLNNSIDAMDGKGDISLTLAKKNNFIEIAVKDSGKGIPPEVLDKLRNGTSVTSGKKDGHGIGFTQIRETVKNNNGTINIDSVLNQGTTITILFPEIKSPEWLAKEFSFNPKDIVVILDDDSSIHGAWDSVFKKYSDTIFIKHFIHGSEAVAFINSFPDKNKIFLLTDFELLNQKLNGVDVIKQTGVRSVVVTSHYNDMEVLRLIKDNNIKMLPKQLAAETTVIL